MPRFLVLFLTLGALAVFAQPGFFGTNLEGEYSFLLQGSRAPRNDCLIASTARLQLLITPSYRPVTLLVAQPR